MAAPVLGQPPAADPQQQFLSFIRSQADELRAKDKPPQTRQEWDARRAELRQQLLKAWGGFPVTPCPLEPRILGTLKRDGYRVEKVIFQTRPGVWMTANAYVPDRPGKHPAILQVHGHWRGARVDPVLQRRCIGAARLGFFVLVVDAFGAGERGIGKALGEYHGDMTAATLLPVGLPLSGLQVYENMRAVDYLLTRPEVDGKHIGITGASGGGNQTMYAGAWDDRLSAAVPVCSVGTYRSYLGTGCCMCEVVPGAMRFTEESGILGLTAPRGLMVVNATRDSIQFSVGEAKKSLAGAEGIFRLYDRPNNVRHTIFESPHDYSKAMREAMYGWMALHLKGEGDGKPIPEADIKTEPPEELRCFPGDSRPADFVTIPRFAAAEARKLLEKQAVPAHATAWATEVKRRRQALVDDVFGGFPQRTKGTEAKATPAADGNSRTLRFQSEPGVTLTAEQVFAPGGKKGDVAVLLDLDGADKTQASPLAKALREAGWSVITIDVRATGKLAPPKEVVGRAPDHHSAEWSLWIGRPLLGQWTFDVSRLLDALAEVDGAVPRDLAVIGRGPAGIVALTAAATDDRIRRAAAIGALASFVTDVPYQGQRLGLMVPGILRDVGDIAHLAALSAPRRVVLAGAVWANGKPLTADERQATFAFPAQVWRLHDAADGLRLLPSDDAMPVVQSLR